jgi:SAM-dependent methyltransferase
VTGSPRQSAARDEQPIGAPPACGLRPAARNEEAAALAPSLYDGNAEWYDQVMRDPDVRGGLRESAFQLLQALVGRGTGIALDIACGTGIAASLLRNLGYRPIGLDYSADQLRIAHGRLPVAQADAQRLPIVGGSIPLAVSTFAFGDWADLAASAADLHRALRPGGRFVDITVHPCFNGGFAQAQPDGSVLLSPGYRRAAFLAPDHFESTIRSRVGAWHRPLDAIVNTFLAVGFQLNKVVEDGPGDLPSILALSFVKP